MKLYTVSFIFTPDFSQVLLVHKLAPEWQIGKLNGVGGKIEEGETPLACIVREVKEETNLDTDSSSWIHVGAMSGTSWHLELFTYIYEGSTRDAITAGKEKIEWFSVDDLPDSVIFNLKWLIPLCIELIRNRRGELDYSTISINI
jgi:8-oxo-dGTP diphosphatase